MKKPTPAWHYWAGAIFSLAVGTLYTFYMFSLMGPIFLVLAVIFATVAVLKSRRQTA